ncbi:XkdX family protein [Bacillus subtilis]|uniref:XkdX family protein n=1 Tax=Bacillus subtilis TaxID=1423 RepID=UPI001EFBEE71|nr:XkdX family protein [Bacillus subtilis]MEC1007923.1 XkdX family protein [Bacillus subtilis]MEC1072855.1 XkdX family protein [Bacillus subtilis]ULN55613.1 XkdX family protein [Bacillus subtilis]WOA21197.1 XkdX family protein [Bacillus subtilis]
MEENTFLYNAIKLYYAKGYYDKQQVARFVELGKISREQYAAITGEVYSGTVPAEPTPEDPPTETPPSTEEPTNDGTDGGDTEPPSEGPSGATDGSTGTE